MKIFRTDHFALPLPPHHPFPAAKYTLLRQRVEQLPGAGLLLEPPPASDVELALAHDAGYVRRVATGALDPLEIRHLGFPWSKALVERSRRSCGATIEACRAALHDGIAVNLAGGTHHAFRDRGEGYCLFNDTAVSAALLRAEGLAHRLLVIDCDVHQGNGTAAMLRPFAEVFTLSIHGARNYPRVKEVSSLDIALADRTGDDAYLAALDDGLDLAFASARPELAIFLAGADPLATDRFGRLALTHAGLRERDRRVLERCATHGVPVCITMAGGYSRQVADTVAAHVATVEEALAAG